MHSILKSIATGEFSWDIEQNPKSIRINNELKKLDTLSNKYYSNGNFYDCIHYLREAYEIRLETLGSAHEETLQNMSNLASALARVGNFDESETYFKKVFEEREELYGPNDERTLTTMNHLGVLAKQRHQIDKARDFLKSAYDGFQTIPDVLGPTKAEVCYNYAVILVQLGDRSSARKYFAEAHSLLSEILGSTHQHTLDALHWERKCSMRLRLAQQSEATLYSSKLDWKSATHCEVCHSKFGVRQREHHCRICSRSVCSACSPYRSVVTEFDKKLPSRICSVCEQQGF